MRDESVLTTLGQALAYDWCPHTAENRHINIESGRPCGRPRGHGGVGDQGEAWRSGCLAPQRSSSVSLHRLCPGSRGFSQEEPGSPTPTHIPHTPLVWRQNPQVLGPPRPRTPSHKEYF